MSQEMAQAMENLERLLSEYGGDQLETLKRAHELVARNLDKIWLRTRSGKPMAERLLGATARLLELEGRGEELEEAVRELAQLAREIDEESQRRNMVVT